MRNRKHPKARKPSRKSYPKRSALPARTATPRKRRPGKSAAKKFAREYHSDTFVEWIREQPSVASGLGPCEAAHVVKGDGGTSRKAGWESCAPLTHHEHIGELHQWGPRTFEAHYGISLEDAAANTRAAFLAYLAAKVAA